MANQSSVLASHPQNIKGRKQSARVNSTQPKNAVGGFVVNRNPSSHLRLQSPSSAVLAGQKSSNFKRVMQATISPTVQKTPSQMRYRQRSSKK